MLNAFESGLQAKYDEAILRSCVTSIYPPNVQSNLLIISDC